jgi:hypothetical protein
MGIIRRSWQCNNCGTISVVRIGIGINKNEYNFSYECKKCNNEIKAHLICNQEKDRWLVYDINGAADINKVIMDIPEDYIFTYDPDFTNRRTGNFNFPFIDAASKLDANEFHTRVKRRQVWYDLSIKRSNNLKTIYKNYNLNNEFFEKGIREFIYDIPLENEMDKVRALYQVLELFMSPIVSSKKHIEFVEFINSYLMEIRSNDEQKLKDFLNFLESGKYLKTIQDKSFKCTFDFIDLNDVLSQVIFEWDPENPKIIFPSDSVVVGNVQFDRIKSFYVDGYELISKSLNIIIGLINIKYRHNYDSFAKHPRINITKPFATDMKDFIIKNNAPKFDLLSEEGKLTECIIPPINPKLRNAIGHNNIELNPKTGLITYYEDDNRLKSHTITYGEFLFMCIGLMVRVHEINLLIRGLYYHLIFGKMKQSF